MTIFIGGDDAAFSTYGSFLGLAEQVDVGNLNPADKAFVFSDHHGGADAGTLARALADTIAHEAGHLLGYEHDHDREIDDAQSPLHHVAAEAGEIIVANSSTDGAVKFYDQQGNELRPEIDADFLEDDELAVGDVNNNGHEEIVVARGDPAHVFTAGDIRIYNQSGDLIDSFDANFGAGDAIEIGIVTGDGAAEIVAARQSSGLTANNIIYIYDMDGTLLNSFDGLYKTDDALSGGGGRQ